MTWRSGKTPAGFFGLKTCQQLFEKLSADFARLNRRHRSLRDLHYAAFNFFVTAHHLGEWVEKSGTREQRQRTHHADHQLLGDLANGAKHFSGRPRRPGGLDLTYVDTIGPLTQNRPGLLVECGVMVDGVGRLENAVHVAERVMKNWAPVFAPRKTRKRRTALEGEGRS